MSQTPAASNSTPASEKPKGPIRRFFGTWIGSFVLAILILTPVRSSIVDWYDVPSGSMEPSILPGDRICANKLAYGLRVPLTFTWVARWGHPEPGEIIIVHSPEEGGTRLVKRVIGKPGDTIEMKDNVLMINGKVLETKPLTPEEQAGIEKTLIGDFSKETLNGREHLKMLVPGASSPLRTFGPVKVPEGKYWVMGDNRDRSKDSRVWGYVDEKKVTGRSSVVAFSLTDYYVPRLSRFFKSIR
jgi:signal peptidase I